jgi:hypothetical protein
MAKEKDKTEVGITGKPVPKPKTAKQQYELEKKRRMGKHLGKNVGGTQYSSDVNPYLNPRSIREEIVSYLLDRGFASDRKSAEAIVGAMSEEWKQNITEAVYGGESPTDTPADKRMVVTNADKKANTKAWQEYSKGNPAYRPAAHLKGV